MFLRGIVILHLLENGLSLCVYSITAWEKCAQECSALVCLTSLCCSFIVSYPFSQHLHSAALGQDQDISGMRDTSHYQPKQCYHSLMASGYLIILGRSHTEQLFGQQPPKICIPYDKNAGIFDDYFR